MRAIDRIVVHHSASDLDTTTADIDEWHTAKGWSGCGYHFVIEGDGRLVLGRPVDRVGAHVAGHNEGSVGICVVGDNTTLAQRWTQAQVRALKHTVDVLSVMFQGAEVCGHRDMPGAKTECPGLDVRALLCLDGKGG